ncbi:Valine--tRNA ligase [Methanimicrococcus hongohii]|uniref:Valine--tRNA ligase n=1 Tax=Methanimicrococcus hongohii TaxID=3028295 RepID=A0AA96ZS41_9EURY|nr:valine--tRNA ligase [Methanimicrococcus sp. Hf6]WNY23015.1 Valine--tRNA ligase [Methanimicrococcus sp. Hf6]
MTGSEIPKEYNAAEIEIKWMNAWDLSMYHFDWADRTRPQYIIDTPPPYPTGNFHIGNSLNWCYIDFVARYKRMRGFNVMFPQGWDCHGLPTEVKVEETHKITKNQVPRAEFRKMCEDMTHGNIIKMRDTMKRLGFSNDWSNEFITMEPSYYVKTQRSFLKMFEKDYIYHEEHPVNWCPRCETAIALAEVEYRANVTKLNFLYFSLAEDENEKVHIATTRPELLCACAAVAVNPEDTRYGKFVGKELVVPIFGQKVPIIADADVDAEFGTGAVMICTFGDKQDIRWTKTHNLKITKAIDRNGKMTAAAGKYQGMSIPECKANIIEDLKCGGFLYEQQDLDQNVGLCWRCKTPIEILSEMQWFVKVRQDEILAGADQIEWIPDYMKVRLENWTSTMEWDWCISRQRIFATPIPVWYCNKCDDVLIADDSWLPIDPTQEKPPVACSKCGANDFHGETDVFDTWMDSSLTALHVSGWDSDKELRLPTQLRPQGHDIIRTWAFYTILRSEAIENKIPWETIMINGMVLGPDGHKMSKSLGNIISPEDVLVEHSADAFRQWGALGGSVGSDVMFRWNDVVSASRLIQKLWNIYRFSLSNMDDFGEKEAASFDVSKLKQIDFWLLSKLNGLIDEVTDAMEIYKFDDAFKAIRVFAWDVLADNYIELVKGRLYGADADGKAAARFTLFTAVSTLTKLLAPFTPFLSEEMYSRIGEGSVHQQSWPAKVEGLPADADEKGELIKGITSAIRCYKSDNKMALNAPLKKIEIYNAEVDTADISNTVTSPTDLIAGAPEFESVPVEVKPNMGMLGPMFRDKAGAVIGALKKLPPKTAEEMKASGTITIDVAGESVELSADAIEIKKEMILAGREIDILHVDEAVIVIVK